MVEADIEEGHLMMIHADAEGAQAAAGLSQVEEGRLTGDPRGGPVPKVSTDSAGTGLQSRFHVLMFNVAESFAITMVASQ